MALELSPFIGGRGTTCEHWNQIKFFLKKRNCHYTRPQGGIRIDELLLLVSLSRPVPAQPGRDIGRECVSSPQRRMAHYVLKTNQGPGTCWRHRVEREELLPSPWLLGLEPKQLLLVSQPPSVHAPRFPQDPGHSLHSPEYLFSCAERVDGSKWVLS